MVFLLIRDVGEGEKRLYAESLRGIYRKGTSWREFFTKMANFGTVWPKCLAKIMTTLPECSG
jgi:hypothetical protein